MTSGGLSGEPSLGALGGDVWVGAWQRRRHQSARIASGVFLVGLFLDYGGGFGLKYIAIGVAFGWVLLRWSSYEIWRRHWPDFLVLLGLPALLSLGHLMAGLGGLVELPDPLLLAVRFYNTISSPALLLLLPMLYAAGVATVARQIGFGFRLVAVFLLALFVFHASGAIDLGEYTEFFEKYQLGAVGVDARIVEGSIVQQGQYSLRVAFAMPMILGYELGRSGLGAMLLCIGFLIVGSRGLLLGVVLLLIGWMLLSMSPARRRILLTRTLFAVVLIAGAVAMVPALQFRLRDVFVERTVAMLSGEDYTTLVRLGHLAGYGAMVTAEPWKLLVGSGPTGAIQNPFYAATGGEPSVTATEFSLLNVALYYGAPYALLYALWLCRGALRLWRLRHQPDFQRTDLGLILGALVFWLTGNTNPQMTAPFAILAYMLLAVRRVELAGDRPALP